MAGDWMKVEKVTPDKPEVAILARKMGVSIGEAFLAWFRVYAWADGMTCPGVVPNLSLADVDHLAHVPLKTAEHLASKEIGWLRCDGLGVHFEKWDRHNGKSAKTRALESEKKRNQRGKTAGLSPDCPVTIGTTSGPEREESERENLSLNSERKANGSAGDSEPSRDHPRLRSQRWFFVREGRTLAKLDELDWCHVCSMANAAAKRIPAITEDDRRQWLRFGVLAATAFSEDWLLGAADAVVKAKQTKRTKQAHFVGVLKARAADSGYESEAFLGMLGSIEIPDDVWKSSAVEILK